MESAQADKLLNYWELPINPGSSKRTWFYIKVLPEPDFKEENGVMTVTFYKDKLNKENLKKLGLNDRQIKAVLFVKGKGEITNKNIQELFKVSRETATRDLILLLEKDILLSSGSKGAGAYYVLK